MAAPARASRRLTPRGLDRADGAGGSCPGGFPWTLIRDRAFWDGGLTDNTPLKPVIDNLHGDEPETMPIIMIDVFSSSAPQPANMQQVVARMFEMFLQNKLKADNDTSRSYTRFISVLKQVDQQLPADARVRKDKEGYSDRPVKVQADDC